MAAAVKVVSPEVTIVHTNNLIVPRPVDAEIDAGKYTVMVLFNKSEQDFIKQCREAINQATKILWPEKAPGGMSSPLKDGDAKFAEDEAKNWYLKGKYYLNGKTTTKPKVFDAQLNEIVDPAEIVSGDRAKVSLNFKAFDKAGNRGVGVYLNGVQVLGRGPVVIGGSNAKDDFKPVLIEEVF